MKRTTPISLGVGNQEILVAVTYRFIPGHGPTETCPGWADFIEVDDAVFLLRDNQRPEVPQVILDAIQADVADGGPIWDTLIQDVREMG